MPIESKATLDNKKGEGEETKQVASQKQESIIAPPKPKDAGEQNLWALLSFNQS